MIEEFEKYLKKRKRQKILKKIKRYGIIAGAVLIPVIVIIIIHILKKKAKKKVKQVVKAKVQEQNNRESVMSKLREYQKYLEDKKPKA